MQRVAFRMKLFPGMAVEYKRRHDDIWPELLALLRRTGVSEYSIFLDESTNDLFGVLQCVNATALDRLPDDPIVKKWWASMKDVMETNTDNSPISLSLREVFYLT